MILKFILYFLYFVKCKIYVNLYLIVKYKNAVKNKKIT